MVADGANVGGLGAYDDVAAVAALPHLDLALLEHLWYDYPLYIFLHSHR